MLITPTRVFPDAIALRDWLNRLPEKRLATLSIEKTGAEFTVTEIYAPVKKVDLYA